MYVTTTVITTLINKTQTKHLKISYTGFSLLANLSEAFFFLRAFAQFRSCFWGHMDPSALKEGYRLLIIQARPREGAKRLGQGQSAVDFSSDRKRAKKKKVLSGKNDWPFCQQKQSSGVWMTKMPLTG